MRVLRHHVVGLQTVQVKTAEHRVDVSAHAMRRQLHHVCKCVQAMASLKVPLADMFRSVFELEFDVTVV